MPASINRANILPTKIRMCLVVDAVVLVENQASLQNPVPVVQPDPVRSVLLWKILHPGDTDPLDMCG